MFYKNEFDFYKLNKNEYYIRREVSDNFKYEEIYWGEIIDPDGNIRNRLNEREKYIKDLKNELFFVNNLKPGKLMDVGCGLGFFLSGINNVWKKFGVEISEYAGNHARKWAEIFIGDLNELNLKDRDYDVIILHHVIEHVEDPLKLLLEIKRILKINGHLVLGTPDFDSGCARLFGKNYRLLNDPTHISLFSNDSMHRFLRDHGFKVNFVDYPFFNTNYFNKANLNRLFDQTCVSPPFYGNYMTFYCKI